MACCYSAAMALQRCVAMVLLQHSDGGAGCAAMVELATALVEFTVTLLQPAVAVHNAATLRHYCSLQRDATARL